MTSPISNPGEPSGSRVHRSPVRVLFNVFADEDNYNAQSLNSREIALRLDPKQYCSTLFFERQPDPRLLRPGIRLVKVPERRKTLKILANMLGSHDFIVYIDLSPASFFYLHVPYWLRRSTRSVLCIEGSRGNLDGVSPTVKRYAEYVAHHADIRVAISGFLVDELRDVYGLKTDFTIPVGVDTRVFAPPAIRTNKTVTVLFVGHLIERKGPHLMVEAARKFPEAKFRIVGQIRDEFGRRLKHEVEAETSTNVTVEGPVPQSQLVKIMQGCDVLVLPSRVEGVPKVTLEAAATGLPCVIFDDYQTPSVLDNKTGFQVKTFEEMMTKLGLLISDASLRTAMGAAAVQHAKSFDWECVSKQWADLFSTSLELRQRVATVKDPERPQMRAVQN